MSSKANLTMVRELLDTMRRHDVEKAVTYYAEDCTVDIVPMRGPVRGRAGLAAAWRMAWSAFPDQYYTEKRMFAGEDHVVFEGIMGGTHKGPYMNIPPTGKHIAWRVAFIWWIVGGKVQEWHSYWDAADLLRQIGMIPPSTRLPLEGA